MNLRLHLVRGMKVGLYGGTFDPAHAAHRHVAEVALQRLDLDKVVWLVSPQNPLKARKAAGLADRMAGARRVADHPSMIVSDAETQLGLRYTLQTIKALQAHFPGVRFVWIMGADNLPGFHRWKGWADIFRLIPIAIIPRPGSGARARFAPAPRRFAQARLPASAGRRLARSTPPAWIDIVSPLHPLSSTALRQANRTAQRLVEAKPA